MTRDEPRETLSTTLSHGMRSTFTEVIFLGLIAVTAFVAVWSLPSSLALWPIFVVLGVLCAGATALTFGTEDPLALRFTTIACIAGPASVLVMLLTEPQLIERARPAWLLSSIVIMCVVLCLRGRFILAWASFGSCYLLMIVWELATSDGLPRMTLLVVLVSRLAVGTAFALVLRHAVNAIRALNEAEASEHAREAGIRAAREERASRLADLESMVRPMLNRIAAGEHLSAADRKTCALLEGQLRDQIQAAALANPAVAGNARAARRRGVDVVMVDDGGLTDTSTEVHQRVTKHVNEVLRTSVGGHLRIRILPPGRTSLISIYRSDEKSGTMRIDLDVHGDPTADLAG